MVGTPLLSLSINSLFIMLKYLLNALSYVDECLIASVHFANNKLDWLFLLYKSCSSFNASLAIASSFDVKMMLHRMSKPLSSSGRTCNVECLSMCSISLSVDVVNGERG